MKTLRASSMDLLFKCAGSLHNTEAVRVDEENEAAEIGTEVHALLAKRVSRWPFGPSALSGDSDDVRFLYEAGTRWWAAHGETIPDAVVETALSWQMTSGEIITGHPDVLSMTLKDDGWDIAVVDWKTTRLFDVSYHHQMMCYLWLSTFRAITADKPFAKFTYIVVYLRDIDPDTKLPNYELVNVPPDMEVDWAARFITKVLLWDGVYRPGKHCTYCPIHIDCPARTKALAEGVNALVGRADTLPDDPARIVAAYKTMQTVEKAVKDLRAAIRQHIEDHGPIQGDGFDIVLQETQGTDVIDPQKAWPVMNGLLTDDEVAKCVTVQKNAFLGMVASKTPHGKKQAARGAAMGLLRDAGAVGNKQQKARLTLIRTGVEDE